MSPPNGMTAGMTGMRTDTRRPLPYGTGTAGAALGRRGVVSEWRRMESFCWVRLRNIDLSAVVRKPFTVNFRYV